MKNLPEYMFDWVEEYVEVELSKLYGRENGIEESLCVDNRLGIAYIDDYLSMNLVVGVGIQRDTLEALISIYKYAKIDRPDILSKIQNLKHRIQTAQWIDDVDAEMSCLDEVQYFTEVLNSQDTAFIRRLGDLSPNLTEFSRLKDVVWDSSEIKSSDHHGQLQAE